MPFTWRRRTRCSVIGSLLLSAMTIASETRLPPSGWLVRRQVEYRNHLAPNSPQFLSRVPPTPVQDVLRWFGVNASSAGSGTVVCCQRSATSNCLIDARPDRYEQRRGKQHRNDERDDVQDLVLGVVHVKRLHVVDQVQHAEYQRHCGHRPHDGFVSYVDQRRTTQDCERQEPSADVFDEVFVVRAMLR